jgi:hypothetical protein
VRWLGILVRFAGRDRVWVALPQPRDPKAMAYDREGRLVANMQTTDRHGYGFITQITEAGPRLYFGSIEENAIGRLPLTAAGLAAPPPAP